MREKFKPETSPVKDIEEAREGAYAEKPFRDTLIKYEKELPRKAKKALEWIASKEGEKAMAKYREEKSAENPVIKILREKAIETLGFSQDDRNFLMDKMWQDPDDRTGEKKVNILQEAVKQMSLPVIEGILSSSMRIENTKDRLIELGFDAKNGLKMSYDPNVGYDSASNIAEKLKWGSGKKRDLDQRGADTLRGLFVGFLMRGEGEKAIESLQIIDSYYFRNYPSKYTSGEEIKKYLDFISEARRKEIPRQHVIGEGRWDKPINPLDYGMEQAGYLWDKDNKKYIFFKES